MTDDHKSNTQCNCRSTNGRTYCHSTPCVLRQTDQLLEVDKLDEAKTVLQSAVNAGSTCDKLKARYREICNLLRRKSSKRSGESDKGSSDDTVSKTVDEAGPCQVQQVTQKMESVTLTEQLGKKEAGDELDCALCFKLLYEPVTTPCGHTFCKMCLARVIDYTSACPFCRTVLHLGDPSELPQCVVLTRLIRRLHPTLYEERRKEMKADPCIGETFTLPLFTYNAVVFPGQKFPMHIFEPKYRLMLRRVMAGARKFGLVSYTHDANGNVQYFDIGCLLEVKKAERTPDGRSIIDTTGTGRFRILNHEEMDGYVVGKVQRYYDTEGLDGDEVAEVSRKARKSIQDMLVKGGRCPTMQNALQLTGPVPCESKGPSALGLWIAGALVNDLDERRRLLRMTDALERLKEMNCCLDRYFRSNFCPYSSYVRNRECILQ